MCSARKLPCYCSGPLVTCARAEPHNHALEFKGLGFRVYRGLGQEAGFKVFRF